MLVNVASWLTILWPTWAARYDTWLLIKEDHAERCSLFVSVSFFSQQGHVGPISWQDNRWKARHAVKNLE